MERLYTALDVRQYRKLLDTRKIPLSTQADGSLFLEFSEDKSLWVERLQNQEDLEDVNEYKYSIVIEFKLKAHVINEIIKSNETGRLSGKIIEFHKTLNKPGTLPEYQKGETEILCILDAYQSDETDDRVSQLWILITKSEESELWKTFSDGIYKISSLGGIPGAVEASDALKNN